MRKIIISAFFLLFFNSLISRGAVIKTIPTADGIGIFMATVETTSMEVVVNCGSGARVEKVVDKKIGKNIVYWDPNGYGGLFDDRHTFTSAEYKSSIALNTPGKIVLKCEVSSPEGIKIKKEFIFEENKNYFTVNYTVSNWSYKPFTFWIRNFGIPLGKENSEENIYHYWQNEKLISKNFPSDYQENISDGWFAIVNKKEKSGFGFWSEFNKLDKFYFWQGSRIFPTCELIYKTIPEGKEMDVRVLFILVNGFEKVGSINEKGEIKEEEVKLTYEKKEVFRDIAGWKSLEDLYNPTKEEKDRKFLVLLDSEKNPRPRLEKIEVDLGKNEKDFVPLTVFGLEDTDVSIKVRGMVEKLCKAYVEKNYQLIESNTISIKKGEFWRFWLNVDSGKNKPGKYLFEIILNSGTGKEKVLPGMLNIWNVELPSKRYIGLKPYAWIVSLTGEKIEDQRTKDRLDAFLENMSQLRCNVCDWAYPTHYFLNRVKIKGTGKTLEIAGKNREISLDLLPEFDFSFYDPWIEGAAKKGMTRFEINVNSQNDWREGAFINGLFPDKKIDPNSEEGWKIILHLYSQFKKYAESKGMKEFWAKIDDEISPEHIPTWNKGAERYQSIGYKTYTTVTGSLPRNAKWLNDMNPYADGWQVSWCTTKDFFNLTRKKWDYKEYHAEVKTRWGKYTNGGAIDTWCTIEQYFKEEKPAHMIEDIVLIANGKELKRKGGSGWGNKEKGVFMEYGGYLYVSLPDGSDPNLAKIEVKYKMKAKEGEGEVPVKLDPEDEIWFYGGGNYSQNYSDARKYGWFACAIDAKGYGYWTYWWWQEPYRLVWYDEKQNKIINSPAFEGLRDGNEDAAYFCMLMEKLSGVEKQRIKDKLFFSKDAILKLEEMKYHIFVYDTFSDTPYQKFNFAKREILKLLEKIK